MNGKIRVNAGAFVAMVILSAPMGAEEEDSRQTPAAQCPRCKGWGKEDCSICQGTRSVDVPCDKCGGSTMEDCTSCANGLKKCRNCNGKGFTVVYGAGLGGGVTQRPCSPTVPCGSCRGNTSVPCKKCRATGKRKGPCASCEHSGKQKCAHCSGKGTVAVEKIPPPPEFSSAEEVAALVGRVRAALDTLKGFAKSLETLRSRQKKALARDAELESKVDAIRKALGGDEALKDESSLLEEKWIACRKARESSAQRLEESEKEVLACSQAASALREMARILERPLKAKFSDVAELPAIEATAERCRRVAAAFESDLDDQDRALKSCAKCIVESDAAAREQSAKRESAAREKALLDLAYVKFTAAAEAAARKTGLPEIETALLSSSSSSRSLHAQVMYFDIAAPVADDPETVVPSDAALENLPRFISLVFTKVPEATRIQVTIDGRILGDTGHERRHAIQSFTMERKRWSELVTGQWKDDWSELLSRSKPAPVYPRPVGSVLKQGWPFIVLIVLLFFALSVLFVARSRMFT